MQTLASSDINVLDNNVARHTAHLGSIDTDPFPKDIQPGLFFQLNGCIFPRSVGLSWTGEADMVCIPLESQEGAD